ncbi:uncharacterized protein METZ01_LOCUS102075 [marine metagenome]|uniref:Uroporphyrinogen decarboxylase n=1 Tax=marine metagenome TaxID=408172 RepID=A0A381WA95_9ZZZZ
MKNDRLLRALYRLPVDCTPIWIMRQAGRYLPEYRETRERAGDFLTLCQTPELACEVTLQPLRRFELDAAILFSDILTIPDAMGLQLSINEGEGPRFARPLSSSRDIDRLGVPDPEDDLGYVTQAVRVIRRELDGSVPLIGFAGSPWTLATYMVEGQGSRDFVKIKSLMFDQSEAMHRLLNTLVDSVSLYLIAQAHAGAQVLMVFDTWGGALSYHDFCAYSLSPMTRIVQQVRADREASTIPLILFTKGGGQWLADIADSGCDALGCDWTTSLGQARQEVGDRVALQGNLDPAVLYAKPAQTEKAVTRVLDDFGSGDGHVFNLGHGITPGVDPENVRILVEAVHRQSKRN